MYPKLSHSKTILINSCQYKQKTGDVLYDHGRKPGTRYQIWNWVINSGTESGYLVLATDYYITHWLHKCIPDTQVRPLTVSVL